MKKKQHVNFNINLARKKNNRKFYLKYVKILILIAILMGVGFYFNIIVKPKMIEQSLNGFPFNVDSGSVFFDFEKLDDGFFVIDNRSLNFYKKNGEFINKIFHNYEMPEFSFCLNDVLIYDRGKNNFRIINLNFNNLEIETNNKILLAKIAKNGNCALITESDVGLSELVVFNRKGEQIFNWVSKFNLIVDFDFVNNGLGCVVCLVGVTDDGMEKAIVCNFNFSEKLKLNEQTLMGSMPLSIKATRTGMGLLCDNKFCFLDKNCNLIKSLDFFDELRYYYLSELGYFIFHFENQLYVYDKYLNLLGRMELSEAIKKIEYVNGKILILSNENLIVCKVDLKILKNLKLNKLVDDFFCDGKFLYILFNNQVDKFKIF